MVGAFAVSELTKLSGKHKLFLQTNYLRTLLKNEDYEKILTKNLFIIGCGSKTHELIRILITLCHVLKREMIVNIMDDGKIQEASLPLTFFYSLKDINHKKAVKLA